MTRQAQDRLGSMSALRQLLRAAARDANRAVRLNWGRAPEADRKVGEIMWNCTGNPAHQKERGPCVMEFGGWNIFVVRNFKKLANQLKLAGLSQNLQGFSSHRIHPGKWMCLFRWWSIYGILWNLCSEPFFELDRPRTIKQTWATWWSMENFVAVFGPSRYVSVCLKVLGNECRRLEEQEIHKPNLRQRVLQRMRSIRKKKTLDVNMFGEGQKLVQQFANLLCYD